MNIRLVRSIISKVLLGIGYTLVILQWLWLLIVALPPLVESGLFDSYGMPSHEQAPVIEVPPIEMSPLVLWLVISITVAILLLTVVVIVRLPRAILETSERAVEHTAQAVMPVVTHHKPLPAKKQRVLSRRLKLFIRLVVAVIPGLACLFLPAVESLSQQIIATIGLGLMALSLTAFLAAWLVEPEPATSRIRLPAFRG